VRYAITCISQIIVPRQGEQLLVYIFYDLETSDLDRDFAQIFQIAMVFADDDMNMLSSKDLKCKKLPWIVPSPGAMLITGFTPDDLKKTKMTHLEMMDEVDAWVRSQHWPLTFIGYNSLKFDEPVLRQGLHQTLHDPFLTTGRKNWGDTPNGRADVMNMVKAVHMFAPGTLKLDIKTPSGNPSMTLGNVCAQNGVPLAEEDAHDALVDVKATIGVAKLIKTAAPEIFKQMMSLTTKDSVDQFLKTTDVFAYGQCPYGEYHASITTSITDNKTYNGENIVFDLSFDPKEFLDLSVDEIADLMKQRYDDKYKQPFQAVQKNSQPILLPVDQADAIRPAELDDKTLKKRLALIKNNPDFRDKVAKAAAKARPVFKAGDEIEQKIYDFPNSTVRRQLDTWINEFKSADWSERVDLINGFSKKFEQGIKKQPSLKRYMQFAQRVVYADAPEKMSESRRNAYAKAIYARMTSDDQETHIVTTKRAREELVEIEKARADGAPQWKHVTDTQVRSLKLFYTSLEREFKESSEKKPPAHHNDNPNELNEKPVRRFLGGFKK